MDDQLYVRIVYGAPRDDDVVYVSRWCQAIGVTVHIYSGAIVIRDKQTKRNLKDREIKRLMERALTDR